MGKEEIFYIKSLKNQLKPLKNGEKERIIKGGM